MTDVLVVGAGPTGLTAAAEAVRHGLTVRIIDANASRSTYSKALVLHSRSLEVFADMGFVDSVLQNGQEFRALNIYAEGKAWSRIDFRAIDWQDAIYPFWLSLPQSETERLLEEHLARLGVQVERRTQLIGLYQQENRVQATFRRTDEAGVVVSEEAVEVPWLIGCDGASSTTRKLCRIPYKGTAEDNIFILGDVQIEWSKPEDEGHNFISADGILLVVPMPLPKQYRIIAYMPQLAPGQQPEITLDLLQSIMDQRTGISSRLHDLVWSSSFSVKHLVAANHRQGRVFLAGDAAHIHSPVGGQGLNTGIQDAYNLMWKLALVHQGKGAETLLDSYEVERHAVAEETIKKVSLATKVLTLKNPLSRLVRNQLATLLINTDAVHNRMGRGVGMLDISYQPSPVVREDTLRPTRLQWVRQAISRRHVASPKGPRSGDRAPNVLFHDGDNTHSLADYLYGPQHTLLLFASLSDPRPSRTLTRIRTLVEQRYSGLIKCYLVTTTALASADWTGPVILATDGVIHRRYEAAEEVLYLIRPDHHIAYRGQSVRSDLFASYLAQTLYP